MTEAFADTNLFVRLVDKDDPKQVAAAKRVLNLVSNGELRLHITSLVIAEIVWVLGTSYDYTKERIRDFILTIVSTPGIVLEDTDIVVAAIVLSTETNIDFADAYYISWMQAEGITDIYTFDKRHFSRASDIKVIVPT